MDCAEAGRRGGKAGKGASKRRGGKTQAEVSAYYRKIREKAGKPKAEKGDG